MEALRRVQKCMPFSEPISGPRNSLIFEHQNPIIWNWVLVSGPISGLRNRLCLQILGEQILASLRRGLALVSFWEHFV